MTDVHSSFTLPADRCAQLLSRRLHASQAEIARQWLDRLNALLPVERNDIFPSVKLLDQIPEIISAIADYLLAPDAEEIGANTNVIAKATGLGLLRYEQRASVHQLLREYQILGDLLEQVVESEVARDGVAIDAVSALRAMSRVAKAVRVLQQQTIDTFVAKYTETIDRQTTELRGFNRLVSHEIRQPLGVLQVIAKIWPEASPSQQARLADTLNRNVVRLGDVAEKMERLARLSRARDDSPAEQFVELSALVGQVAEQLADMAGAREVTISVSPDLPGLVVDAARAELVFVNLIANAVKYADPRKASRVVDIEPAPAVAGTGPAVIVRDNGIGIPADRLDAIFQQFVRVHAERDDELGAQGLGLGLSIVRESMDAIGGTVSVSSSEGEGTTFTITWPPPPRG